MKKLFLIFTLLLTAFILAGCNSGGSDIDIDYTEVASAPTHLVITNKVLSWDQVAEADKYIIYVNGEVVATVKANSYDFSALTQSVLVFQVQTDAKRGYQNSGLSVSIAYVANRATEISQTQVLISSLIENSPNGFAEALVDKGMVSSEFEALIDELNAFMETAGSSEGDILVLSGALQTLIASNINFEALINAFLLFVPALIEGNISDLNEEIVWYQYYIDQYGDYGGYYQSQIDEYQSQILMYQELQSAIESSRDDVVLSALHTIEYFVSIVNQLDTEFFTTVQSFVNSESPAEFETSEIILIKEELAAAMLDNLPTMQDMVVLFELISALSSSVSGETSMVNYPTENAAQALLSIEAFAKIIDTIDAAFVNDLKSFYIDDPDTYPIEAMILTIKYFDIFQRENDRLIQEMRNVLSLDQQKALFEDYITAVIGLDEASIGISSNFIDLFVFEDYYVLDDFAYDLMDPVLKWFVDTDGEILRLIYDSSSQDPMGNATANYYEGLLNQIEVMRYASQLVTLISNDVPSDVANALSGIIASSLMLSNNPLLDSSKITDSEFENLYGDVRTNLESEMMTFITLINLFAKKTNSADLFDDWHDTEVDINTYATATFGINYYDTDFYSSSDIIGYARVILFAGFISDFLTNTNQNRVEDIMDMVFASLLLDDFLAISSMTAEEIQLLEARFTTNFDYLVSQSSKIKRYDAFNLIAAQVIEVESFIDTLQLD